MVSALAVVAVYTHHACMDLSSIVLFYGISKLTMRGHIPLLTHVRTSYTKLCFLIPYYVLQFTPHWQIPTTLQFKFWTPLQYPCSPTSPTPYPSYELILGTQNTIRAPPLKTSQGNLPVTLRHCWAGESKLKQPHPMLLSWVDLWRKGNTSTKSCRWPTSN